MKHRCRALLLAVALTGAAVACASEGGGDELVQSDTTTTAPPRTTSTAPNHQHRHHAITTTTTTAPETTIVDETTTTTAPETTVHPATTEAPRTTVGHTTTTSAPRSSTPQRDPDGDFPPGLVTPTGVPVAVLGRTDSGYLVRTPCGNTAEVSEGVFINDARVVIDPGHGGPVDTGAIGPNGLVERDLNLTLSRAVLDELAGRGISAVSTRTGGYGTLLSVRAALADHLGVEALVSIHHNAPTWATSRSPGSEVFIQSESVNSPRADSARLGGLLYEEITAALAAFENVTWSRAGNAGVLRVLSSSGSDAYGMIVRPSVPAVLVEYGYLSNPSEAGLFATDEYVQAAAAATAAAIDAYLHSDRPGTGFVQQPRIFDPQRAPSFCEDPPLE
ncbi:MAG: N-acetylmuramoyl-L-alanine amidase [Acidimicrobiaceae bacterium]|nr:N-acetylmuramoyl-L-alanine amidase [Acidimicrobiaceae bacterium]